MYAKAKPRPHGACPVVSQTIDILNKAGVDMTTSEPVQSVMDRFEYLINEFERLVNEK